MRESGAPILIRSAAIFCGVANIAGGTHAAWTAVQVPAVPETGAGCGRLAANDVSACSKGR